MARHAGQAGADSVMAMPPFVRHPGPDEIVEFYAAVAQAAGVPVWIQDYVAPMGTPMAPALLARLLREIPGVEYLKEETALAPQVMTQVQALAGDALKGMMGGMAGRYLLDEYARGACGTMPACEVDGRPRGGLERAGDAATRRESRRLFRELLPLLNIEAMYSFVVYKEVLYRRGIIACPKSRAPGSPTLDEGASRELDLILQRPGAAADGEDPGHSGRMTDAAEQDRRTLNRRATVPPGWEDASPSALLHRSSSPDGRAVAWICPEIGGNTDRLRRARSASSGSRCSTSRRRRPCSARCPRGTACRSCFRSPAACASGVPVGRQEHVVPPTYPGCDAVVIHGFAHVRPWRFVEQTPRRRRLRVPHAGRPRRRAGRQLSRSRCGCRWTGLDRDDG